MRGATSSDGKISGNVQQVSSYDKHKSQKPKPEGGHSGGAHEPDGHDEIKQVVAEHGPAHTTIRKKKPEGGFSSESHHESGHVHSHPHHDSIADAEEHERHAMDADGDHAEMGDDAEERAGERDGIEDSPRSKTPSFMD